jgi:hypothetical protein
MRTIEIQQVLDLGEVAQDPGPGSIFCPEGNDGAPCPNDCRTVVHPLLFCPPLVAGSRFFLVHRSEEGARRVLHVGRATSPHPTLNLAAIRYTSANLGANEVHVMPAQPCVVTHLG